MNTWKLILPILLYLLTELPHLSETDFWMEKKKKKFYTLQNLAMPSRVLFYPSINQDEIS